MTTTVTIETHDRPVSVSMDSDHNYNSNEATGWGHSHRSEFVPANSKHVTHVSEGATVTVRELPKGCNGFVDLKAQAENICSGQAAGAVAIG